MKKLILPILTAILSVIACQKTGLLPEDTDKEKDIFSASIEGLSTKTFLNEDNGVAWSKGDQITIYNKTTLGSKYQVKDSYEGQTSASFFNVSSDDFGEEEPLGHIIAYYPASDISECSRNDSNYLLSVNLPISQSYSEASFGNGSFPMVAVSDNSDLSFRNICGAIRLRFTGNITIESIQIKGNDNEKLAGKASVTAFTENDIPQISMAYNASTSVTLDCGEGVRLNETEATEFIISLPPTSFSKGFSVIVTDTYGEMHEIETSKPNRVLRSSLLNMPAVEIEDIYEEMSDNKIWYTATEKITPYEHWKYGFVADIISNEYDEETQQGVITFNGPVEAIGYKSFQNCEALTSLTIGDSVTCINDYAFDNCPNLTSINIPDGVTSIGSYAFRDCTSIISLTLPESITAFNERPFQNCSGELTVNCNLPDGFLDSPFYGSSFSNITIGENVTRIGDYGFNECPMLTSVILPEGMLSIGQEAFSSCTNMTDIYIPDSMTSIGLSAFANCPSLKSINLPEGITEIAGQTFFHCSGLESVTIPDSVIAIGFQAFSYCISLKSIELPDGINTIGYGAFNSCTGIEELILPESLTSIEDETLYWCSSLKSIYIPYGVSDIGIDAFHACTSLTDIEIPNSVTTIGKWAFYGCKVLNNIVIPESVTKIGDNAFERCSILTDIHFNPMTPPEVGNDLFFYSSLKNIHVPDEAFDAYFNAPGWAAYTKYLCSEEL